MTVGERRLLLLVANLLADQLRREALVTGKAPRAAKQLDLAIESVLREARETSESRLDEGD